MKTTHSGLWLCHSLQFSVMLTVLSNLVQYYFFVCKPLRSWGPAITEAFALVFLMVFPTVVIMRDLGLSPAICKTPLFSASLKGCAYTGFLLLLSGAAWVAGGFRAASEKMRRLRGKAADDPEQHLA